MAFAMQCSLSHGSYLAAFLALAALASCRRLGAAAAADESSGPKWHVVSVSSLLPSTVCTAAKAASNSSALRVVHRHSPCSPLKSRGASPSHAEILDRDQDRVDYIHRTIAAASVINTAGAWKGFSLPAHWGTSLGINNYIVTVGLGTPARSFSVEFDTGSDLSWVQCKPCRDCYKQQDPLFDPAHSSTYSAVHCSERECQEFVPQNCSSNNKCPYMFFYADQSQTEGNLVRDMLTLTPSKTLPGFVFGCGDANTGLFGEADGLFGEADGLFGLGRDKVSQASQVATKYGAGFSYCLPSSSSSVGYLSFGGAAPGNVQFTAMVTRNEMPSLYYLNLVGIKVAGRAIRIPPAIFATVGTIIDSGTVIGRLPPRAYAAFRSAFTRFMGEYKKEPALSYLDTCYDFTGHTRVKIPSVGLVFADGTTVSLKPRGVLYVSTVSQTCLAFAPIDDDTAVGILGNTQQKTFAVIYDVANQKIGFGANGCI